MEDRRRFLVRIGIRVAVFASALAAKAAPLSAHPGEVPLGARLQAPEYRALLRDLSVTHRFRQSELDALFRRARIQPAILRRYEQRVPGLSYSEYHRATVTPALVARGKQYLETHQRILRRVEQDYGVEPAVIAAILGVESAFGRRTDGGFRVFDALNTLFAGVPRRAEFARRELVEFLLLCREERLDPLRVRGSYAGAMGVPQFMPSSYRRYAVDADRDGRRDLWQSEYDVAASVANYLRAHRWRHRAPIRVPVTADPSHGAIQDLLARGIKATVSPRDLLDAGVAWAGDVPSHQDGDVSLVRYRWEDGERTVAAFTNFRALLRYNQSVNYALAVTDLADALQG